jgi:MFS transporter, MHS family, shikimate and dehydroshikimate transport protein
LSRDTTRVALASLVGTTIEWYDFYLFGTAAALVFNRIFFPTFSPVAGTLASFATFAVGFVARPIGGALFGHYGDRLGRKTALILSLLIMGVATTCMGLLPTFASVGPLAPVLLCVLRFAQGIAVGGEWGGAVLMAIEHAPPGRRGFYGSWPQMGVPIGLVLATLVFRAITGWLTPAQFEAWAWRVPFLGSVILVAVGLFIRLRVAESPIFAKLQKIGGQARMPLVEALRDHPRTVLIAAGSFVIVNGGFYLFTTFILSYGTLHLGLPRPTILNGVLAEACAGILVTPLAGALSDRFGRRPVYLAGAAFMIAAAFPLFFLIDTRDPLLLIVALILANCALSVMYGPQAAFLAESFPARVRYSGASLGVQLTAVVAGGLSPFVATALLSWSGGASWPISLYVMLMATITFIAVWLAGETRERDLG